METTNLDAYGHDALPWSRAERQLQVSVAKDLTHFLTTVRADGQPHVAGIGALWIDGRFYFTSGDGTRKSRDLAERDACVIAVKLPDLDLVVEGTATRVTDKPTLDRLAKAFEAQGWPATVDEAETALTAPYSAPSAGPAPWSLYEFTPSRAFGVATAEPHGATRWDFAA